MKERANLSPCHQFAKILKIAYVCVRLLKPKEAEVMMISGSFPGVTGVPEEGVEPTLTVK
jgi:hypothetical protein